jgi:hypothetical protein
VVADLAVHEHDVRGALDQPGARSSAAVSLAMEFLLQAIVSPGASALGLGPLEIRTEGGCSTIGSDSGASGDPDTAIAATIAGEERLAEQPCGAPVGSVSAPTFELFRALTGRRSAAQIRTLDWSVEPGPFLALFDLWPFTLRDTDLIE